jgi:hypothetical protein
MRQVKVIAIIYAKAQSQGALLVSQNIKDHSEDWS